MTAMRCDKCGEGTMSAVVIKAYQTQLGGMPVTIPEARVHRCSRCGDIAVNAEELKRWRRIQSESLQKAAALPSPADVARTRETLGLSVADFALLLAVTRQTVYGWEDGRLQPGPAAILISLIQRELQGDISGVIDMLRKLAKQRGTPVELTCAT